MSISVERKVCRMLDPGFRQGSMAYRWLVLSLAAAFTLILGPSSAHAQAQIQPSSHCHITDGKFSVCPDGTQEWSDITPIGFPQTNAFLYADQADQTPLLKTPTNNRDTFVLMYDECNRTTPLGPDEYVLVNFKTVEVEDGKERLEHYVIHLFGDGTFIFIEDGKPHPAGRTTVIEGQRGAVTFGPSPNCPTPHVVAEYEIQLTAASSHSYSPDPLYWGSSVPPTPTPVPPVEQCGDGIDNDGNGFVDEGCPPPPSGPKVVATNLVRGGVGPIEMGDLYKINVTALEQNSGFGAIFLTTDVEEQVLDPRTTQLRDVRFDVSIPTSSRQTLVAGGLATNFSHPNSGLSSDYRHYWKWMGDLQSGSFSPLAAGCVPVFADLASAAFSGEVSLLFKGAVTRVASGVATAYDAARNLTAAFASRGLLLPESLYAYRATAVDSFGSDVDGLPNVKIVVPAYKQVELNKYWMVTIAQSLLTNLGLWPGMPPQGRAALLSAEAAAVLYTCGSYDIAFDPDPEYSVLVTPETLNIHALDSLADSSYRRLAEAWRDAAVSQRALARSLAKYEGAKAFGNREWALRQLSSANDFHKARVGALARIAALTESVIAEVESLGLVISRSDLDAVRNQLLTDGLPGIEQDVLRSVGFTDTDIALASSAVAGMVDLLPLDWQLPLRSSVDGILRATVDSGEWIEQRLSALRATVSLNGSMIEARTGHFATRLNNGKVLVAGGQSAAGIGLPSAEVFNPATGSWVATGRMAFGRYGHDGVRLQDGKVLVMGGVSNNVCAGAPVANSAEVYDPATGVWTRTGNMRVSRNSPAAVLLADGRVLVAGGGNRCGAVFSSSEIFDPATGQWTLTGSMQVPREASAGVLLRDGKVLVAGGAGGGPRFPSIPSAEVYDPAMGTWSRVPDMSVARIGHRLTLLQNSTVIVTGGAAFSCLLGGCPPGVYQRSAEVYDPATGVFASVGDMSVSRSGHSATELQTGFVLIAGGFNQTVAHSSTELFDPVARVFSPDFTLPDARSSHSATILTDGKVLIAGGSGAVVTASTMTYDGKGARTPRDTDGDTVADELDNCTGTPNADQRDSNLNGIGDACETASTLNNTAGFLQARADGTTTAETVPLPVTQEPPLAEQIGRIVKFRVDAGLTSSGATLANNLVGSVVELGVVPPEQASALVNAALQSVCGRGDIDCDGDVDQNDLNLLLLDRNKTVSSSSCGVRCDLDGDGKITVLDSRKLVLVCTRPRCVTQGGL